MRCATAVSTLITRSRVSTRAAVSAKSCRSSVKSCSSMPRGGQAASAAGGPFCNEMKRTPDMSPSGAKVSRVIERRLSRRICPGLFIRPPAQQSPTRRPARPATLGMFYSAVTGYLGFEVNEGEYKVMGLAPYGQQKYVKQIGQLIDAGPGGEYRLNLKYYSFLQEDRMFSDDLCELLGEPPRPYGSEITPFHMDVARSAQLV